VKTKVLILLWQERRSFAKKGVVILFFCEKKRKEFSFSFCNFFFFKKKKEFQFLFCKKKKVPPFWRVLTLFYFPTLFLQKKNFDSLFFLKKKSSDSFFAKKRNNVFLWEKKILIFLFCKKNNSAIKEFRFPFFYKKKKGVL